MLLVAAMHVNAQTQQFTIKRYIIEGNTLLAADEVDRIVSAFVGEGRSIDDINGAADALRKAYEASGYAVVRVFPPPQETAQGTIVLRVIEGEIESVSVKGNELYDLDNIRNSLPALQEKSKPNTRRIVAAIAAANENPAKQVAVNFQAAEKLGNIDAVVRVTEDRPEKFTASLDNLGNAASGKRRIGLGYQNANLFNKDHMVTLSVGTSDQLSRGFQVSGGYRLPFYGTGLSLDLIASYSDSNSTSNVGFGSTVFNGKGSLYGVRVNQALTSAGEYRHRLIYGIDYKDFDNACSGVNEGTCGTVTAQPVSLTYVGSLATPDYQLNGSISHAANVGGGAHGSDAEYALARFNADRDWSVTRAAFSVLLPLPEDLQLRASLAGQYSRDRLVPSEQFGAGGAFTVRGYAERSLTGDRGVTANWELYSPKFGAGFDSRLGMRGLLFMDYGAIGFTNSANSLEVRNSIASTGVGLRGSWGKDLSFRLDLGYALDNFAGVTGANNQRSVGDYFGHFGVNIQY
jgi:hemolysin activation/secretion protein